MDECAKGGVDVALGQSVGDDRPCRRPVPASKCGGQTVTAPALVIATGGPSIPKMGATGFAYDLARQFGLKVVEPRPALVPLTLGGDETLFRELSGVATEIVARCGKTEFREAALFTHRGLSGPAILQISSYWRNGEPIGVDFLPDRECRLAGRAPSAREPRSHLRAVLGDALPARLAETLAERIGLCGRARQPARPQARRGGQAARRLALHAQRHAKASPRPKSPPAGSAPPSFRRRRWGRRRSPASTRSARRSTSPVGLAAIISNGPGRVVLRQVTCYRRAKLRIAGSIVAAVNAPHLEDSCPFLMYRR